MEPTSKINRSFTDTVLHYTFTTSSAYAASAGLACLILAIPTGPFAPFIALFSAVFMFMLALIPAFCCSLWLAWWHTPNTTLGIVHSIVVLTAAGTGINIFIDASSLNNTFWLFYLTFNGFAACIATTWMLPPLEKDKNNGNVLDDSNNHTAPV